jgi:hypothetical protein
MSNLEAIIRQFCFQDSKLPMIWQYRIIGSWSEDHFVGTSPTTAPVIYRLDITASYSRIRSGIKVKSRIRIRIKWSGSATLVVIRISFAIAAMFTVYWRPGRLPAPPPSPTRWYFRRYQLDAVFTINFTWILNIHILYPRISFVLISRHSPSLFPCRGFTLQPSSLCQLREWNYDYFSKAGKSCP